MLVLTCDCGNRMDVPDNAVGKTRVCRTCRRRIKILKSNTRAKVSRKKTRPGEVMDSAVSVDKRRIGEMLMDKGLISERQLKEALALQKRKGGKVVEILVSLGYLTIDDFVKFLAQQPGVASIDLTSYQVPAALAKLVPKEIAIEHEVFPIDKMGRLLTLGMVCPLDSATIEQIEERTGLKVKALLCSPEDIRSAIRRYYRTDMDDFEGLIPKHFGAKPKKSVAAKKKSAARVAEEVDEELPKVESGLKLSTISHMVRELKSLPALPGTVERVRRSMTDLTISPKDVSDVIVKDPPVAAKVLSVANSAAYGFRNRVDSIDLAVALMGLRETYSIVLSAAVINLFDKSKTFDYGIYWEEAMNCAAACKIIGESLVREKRNGVFTAGLLHDVGRIALLETVPERYSQVSPELVGDELIEAEMDVLGITHAEAGYELATNWGLPVEIAEPIRFHHTPEYANEAPESVAVVTLAERWTRTENLAESDKDTTLENSADVLNTLAINGATASEIFDKIADLQRVRFEWGRAKRSA